MEWYNRGNLIGAEANSGEKAELIVALNQQERIINSELLFSQAGLFRKKWHKTKKALVTQNRIY